MAFKCYHCQGSHDTAYEGRVCAADKAVDALQFTPTGEPRLAALADAIGAKPPMPRLSEKQLNFIRSLVARKDISRYPDSVPNDDPKLDGSPSDLEGISKQMAHHVIDFLLGMNDKPQVAEKVARKLPDVPAGYYAIDGNKGEEDKFYRVDRPTSGKWAGRTFVKVQASGEFYPIRNQDEVARILCEIAIDSETAQRRYGQKIGRCGVCNRTLTDDESRAMGIGPVCRSK